MKLCRLTGILLLVCAIVFSGTAFAHDLFIKPESFRLEPGVEATIPFFNGTFAESQGGFAADRLLDLSLVSTAGREQLDLADFNAGETTSTVSFTPAVAGVLVIGASLGTRDITLSAEDFNDYLAHDGIPDILAQRQGSDSQSDVHELYEKHVKSVVLAGDETGGAYDVVLGYPAEIVLLDNPYAVAVGDDLHFRCLVGGEPVANQFVLMGGEADGDLIEEVSVRTDTSGEGRFTLASGGAKYLRFIHMRPSDQPGFDYHSRWATVTFEIGD